jgi:O-antigen ligase
MRTGLHQPNRSAAPLHGGNAQLSVGLVIFFGIMFGLFAWLLMGRAGVGMLLVVVAATVIGALLSYVSWRNMALLVCLWVFSMSGFREYAMIYMPGLPDMSIDRVMVLWLLTLFALRLLLRRDELERPIFMDVLLLGHTMYILANLTYIGNSIHTHVWAVSSLMPFLAYVVGKNIMRQEEHVRHLLIFLFLLCVYYYIQSIAQHLHLNFLIYPKTIIDPSVVDRGEGYWQEGRSRGPFLHPPLFGQVIAMLVPVQFYFFFRVKLRAARILVMLSIVLTGLGLLYTYTRGPWVAAAVGVLMLAVMRPKYRQVIGGLGAMVAIASLVGVLRYANSDFLQERLTNLSTFENRLAALSAALRMWRDHPLFGIGFFNWQDYYPLYQRGEDIPLYGYVSRHMSRGVRIHDIFWGRLAEEGLLSLGLLGAAIVAAWFRLKYLWNRVHDEDWLNRDALATMAAVFVAYLVGGMAIDYRYFDMINVLPYLFAGILFGYQLPRHELPPPPPPYPLWSPPDWNKIVSHRAAAAPHE